MNEDQRKQLLSEYDGMDDTKKFQIDVLMWGAYDKLHDEMLEQNFKIAWEKAGLGEETLDKEFYKRVKIFTERTLESQFMETKDQAGIDEARKAMEMIIKEMKAAKMIGKASGKKAN